jgi:hypothetical protein
MGSEQTNRYIFSTGHDISTVLAQSSNLEFRKTSADSDHIFCFLASVGHSVSFLDHDQSPRSKIFDMFNLLEGFNSFD